MGAFPASMLAVCSQVIAHRSRGIHISFVSPDNDPLKKLFNNSNWAHLLDPVLHDPSRFRGYRHVPATQFTSPAEQNAAVNSILNVIMGSIGGIQRSDLAAIEWSVNEITDNVLTHAATETGGLVQVTTFERTQRRVEFVVCDAGVTIPATLRESRPEINSDVIALERAIREGITRDKSLGQGNGLFGTFEVCRASGGQFHVHSRHARLSLNSKQQLDIRREQIPFSGTLVVASIDCSTPGLLQKALKFGDREHIPIDFIETKYESQGSEIPRFIMYDETSSFGSRLAGEPIRKRLAALARMVRAKRLIVDFAGVPLVSSSFADEVFGKLFLELGAVGFAQSFELLNVSDTVRSLIDKAIAQRIATGI